MRFILTTVLIIVLSLQANSQGTTNVNVLGIPPILDSPFVSDIENNYYQGQYQMQMTYSNPANPNPVEFVYEVTLSRNGEEMLHSTSDPVSYTPGTYTYASFDDTPEISFSDDFLSQFDDGMIEQIVRTGVLPEGSYVLEIMVEPFDAFENVVAVPHQVFFEINFPQPPILISPMDEDIAPPYYAVFSWTPVVGSPGMQFEYELLIVEMLHSQTPQQAIEANREHHLEISNQPQFIYTHEHLPLESGNTYAWMVIAREVNYGIPLSDDGKSEIHTFTVKETFADVDFDELESIQLIPGFAEIVDLDRLEVSSETNNVLLDGFATLRLDFPDQGDFVDIEVTLIDLTIPQSGNTNPIASGGSVSGLLQPGQLPVEGAGDIVNLENIQWSVLDGLTVEGSIIDPTGQLIEGGGELSLHSSGLMGMITATGPGGTPLFELGENPMRLDINSLTARFPNAYLMLDAQVHLFDAPSACQIHDVFDFDDGVATIDFACGVDQHIPLMPDSDLLSLNLNTASGALSFDWGQQDLEFDVSASGALAIAAEEDRTYDIPLVAGISDTQGVSFELYPPAMISQSPPVNLGVAEMLINGFSDPSLAYDAVAEAWDFDVDLDASLRFPAFDDFELHGVHGVRLDNEGITFPDIILDEDDLAFLPVIELAGFGAQLNAFAMSSFTFPWFDWNEMTSGPWDFSFGFELFTPNFGNHLPSCLRNLSLQVDEAGFSGGTFSADIPLTEFDAEHCEISFGAGYGILVNQLGGGISGTFLDGGLDLDGHLSLDAVLSLGTPFDCGDQDGMALGAENIELSGDGILTGNLTNVIPDCPLRIGPYEAVITDSELQFGANSPDQSATFAANAYLEFPSVDGGVIQVDGQIGVDLVTGELFELDFAVDEPFVWHIPREDEVLTFHIQEASIGMDGLYVDGTQTFVVGGQEITVEVNQLLLDLETFSIKEGSIAFSENFAFELGIDPDALSLVYGSVPYDSDLELDPGVLFNLSGDVLIDSLGLQASGTADAQLSFAGFETDELSVEFSENFAFGLDPFGVANGEIDVSYQGQPIAVIDEYGFHPSLSFFNIEEAIPARLPLPRQSIAYIVLKDADDELLIDVEEHPDDDMAMIISTKDDQPVEFVFPLLQEDQALAPTLEVEFSDIVLGLSPLQFESGEIHVAVPEDDTFFDLSQYGIPLNLDQISYGEFDFEGMILEGLFFSGELVLFEQELGPDATASMFVDTDGSLNTTIDLDGINADIPLVGDSDIAVLSVESIAGWAQFHLLQPDLPDFSFDIDGGFEIHGGDGRQARADVSLEYTRHGFSMHHFTYDASGEKPTLDIDPFIFRVDEIDALNLSYDDEGFDFYASLDFSVGMHFEEEDTLLVPLQGVEIRPDGFAIPVQDINDGTEPPLQAPPVSFMGFEMEPLAFRTSEVVVNVFDFSPGDLSGFIPSMDFALTFPGLTELAPEMEGLSVTVLDAGYQNGYFTGSLEVHQPVEPISIPLGDTAIEIAEFAGELYEALEDGESRQAIEVNIEGSIPALHQFESDEPCDPIDFSLLIVEGSGFAGTIENIAPCGTMPLGSLGLSFADADLELDFMDGQQMAYLSGAASLQVPRESQPDLNVSGDLSLDLISGNILDGMIEITDAFMWHFPATAEDPFLSFNVEQARLDSLGLTFQADGSMQVTEGVTVDVAFDDLVLQLSDLSIADGQASISSGFAFEMLFLPVQWQLASVEDQLPADQNAIRIDLSNAGMVMDADGLAFTGEASASINLPDMPDTPGGSPGDDPDGDPGDGTGGDTDDDPDGDMDGDPDGDSGQPGDPDDDEQFYDNLRIEFTDDFRMHMPPGSKAKDGRAEIWLDEDEESTLLAWYDTDGLGLGNFLGAMPIPDTLGLPDKDIAYLVLKDEGGNLLVELDTDGGDRTLQTLDGETIDLVIAGLEDEEGESPRFSTAFSITVNDAFELTNGSISINMDENEYGNQPFNHPDLPLTLTSLTYEERPDGSAALTASALLDLPESLDEVQVSFDEIRFSPDGFEQASFHIGNEDAEPGAEPEIAHSFADDAFIFNLHYAEAAFGEENAFSLQGSFQSSFFMDEDGDSYSPIPFNAHYDETNGSGSLWSFATNLEYTDTLEVSGARFALTGFGIEATESDFALMLSGAISMPDLMGDDFAVTIEDLSLGTSGISVGSVSPDAQEQEFYLFNERVRVLVSSIGANYEGQQQVLYVSLDGELEVLEREVAFSDMTIGSDGSFSVGDGIDVNLLTQDISILGDQLLLEQIAFGLTDENRLRLSVTGNVTLPDPFDQSSDFTVMVAQVDRSNVDVSVEGPHFQFGEGFEISDDRTQVTLGEFATFDLTAAAVDLDFKHIGNTTFYATAALYVENDPDKRVEFGEAGNIYDDWGFRFNYFDGFQWNITSTATGDNPLFAFDGGFFQISIHSLATYQDDFGLEVGGKAEAQIPGISGEADFAGFRVYRGGIDDIGYFDGEVNFTLMNKVTLSLGDFDYAPQGGTLDKEIEETEPDGTTKIDEEGNPVTKTEPITTLRHLRILDAGITVNGAGNGNGGGFDSFSGGVDEVLFYVKDDGTLHLYIDNANLDLGDFASVAASMRYKTADNFFHLSVAGTASIGGAGAGLEAGLAGKIEVDHGDLSFGLFVRASVDAGIPIIPGIVTLNGAGGGFFYRPDQNDFSNVRLAAGLNYLEEPQFDGNLRFAAFLQAEVSIIQAANYYYVRGAFFLEVTDQFTSLHVNGTLMGQPEDDLAVNLFLNVDYGSDSPGVQGLARIDIDYSPVVDGHGQIGFFAYSIEGDMAWAIYGDKHLSVLSALNMESEFVVSNEGLLIGTGISVYIDRTLITIDAGMEASIWYIRDGGFGAYGHIWGNVRIFGVTIGGELYGAYISSESLLYARGSVYVDTFLKSGWYGVWGAYHDGSWDGGRGSSDKYDEMIAQAMQEANNLKNAADEAADQVNAAQEALDEAANVEALVDELTDWVDDFPEVVHARNTMQYHISNVNSMAPALLDRIDMVIDEAREMQAGIQLMVDDLQNPVNPDMGQMTFDGDSLVVAQSPSIGYDENIEAANKEDVEAFQAALQQELENYEEAIGMALANLAELEMIIEGSASSTSHLLDRTPIAVLDELVIPLDQIFFDPDFVDPDFLDPGTINPPAFGPPPGFSGPMPDPHYAVSGPNPGSTGGFGIPGSAHWQLTETSGPNLNDLSTAYAWAVESVKRFYAIYSSQFWFIYSIEAISSDPVGEEAALIVLASTLIDYQEKLPGLEQEHANLTNSIDLIYTIKGEMITTIYGMIEEYAALLEHSMEEGELEGDVDDMKQDLVQMLEPPVINSFIINPDYKMYRNHAHIEWVAQHDVEVVETSYSIQEQGVGPFTSAGNLSSIEHTTFKRDVEEEERDYTIAIRARGIGGNTAIRVAEMTLRVDADGEDSPGGDQEPDNVPPPSDPTITLPYNFTLNIGPNGFQGRYHSGDPEQIELSITAHSEYSDITAFEYAVGSHLGATDVVDWTTAVGVIEPVDVDEGGVTRKIDTSISGLNLEHDNNYYVMARAYDAHDNFSSGQAIAPVKYDATPPSKPELEEPAITIPNLPTFPLTPPVQPQVASAPDWHDGKYNFPQNLNIASLDVEFQESEDPESGIKHYEYILASWQNPDQAFQNAEDVLTTTQSEINLAAPPMGGSEINYHDSLYLHVRAINHAGTPGEAATLYPAIARDNSRPTRPAARVRISDDALRLYLTHLSLDAESQTVGYQYSIGTAPGQSNVRSWGTDVDFPQSQELHGMQLPGHFHWVVNPEPTHVPMHMISAADLPEETDLYVNIRAVNGQGAISLPATTGPFQVGTSPEEPDVSLSYNEDAGTLQIQIDNVYDQGAPIHRVSYRIKNNDNGQFITIFPINIPGAGGFYTQPGSVSVTANVPHSESGYTVYVFVYNSGLNLTTVTETYTHPIVWNPPIIIPPTIF